MHKDDTQNKNKFSLHIWRLSVEFSTLFQEYLSVSEKTFTRRK